MSNAAPAAALPESFAALFEESLTRKEMRTGEVITAEVVRLDVNYVVVNAGLKSESFIAIDEFKNDKGEVEVKPGDFVSVAIEALGRLRRDAPVARQGEAPRGLARSGKGPRSRHSREGDHFGQGEGRPYRYDQRDPRLSSGFPGRYPPRQGHHAL